MLIRPEVTGKSIAGQLADALSDGGWRSRARPSQLAGRSLSVTFREEKPEWHFLAVSSDKKKGASVSELARMMTQYDGVESFHVCHQRH
jgi:hypothetical protein